MPSPEETYSWAQKVCQAAFIERGEPLREGDSIILVAAVFRACLDGWLVENGAALDKQNRAMEAGAMAWQNGLGGTLDEHSKRLREGLESDLSQAGYLARQAAEKALSIAGKDSHWKYRMEGLLLGVGIVLVSVLLYRFF